MDQRQDCTPLLAWTLTMPTLICAVRVSLRLPDQGIDLRSRAMVEGQADPSSVTSANFSPNQGTVHVINISGRGM